MSTSNGRPASNARLGIVEFSLELFNECVTNGFPFPAGTTVRGIREDGWNDRFQVLVESEGLTPVNNGERIPTYALKVCVDGGPGEFVPLGAD